MLIDISPRIDETITVWPGDVPFTREVSLDLERGDHLTLSSIRTTLHVGAHADSPTHYALGVGDLTRRPLETFVGPCEVVRVSGVRGRRIMPGDLRGVEPVTPRVLFRTDSFPDPRGWNDDFAALSPELVELLHSRGVSLVGIDTPSVDPFDSKALEAHHALGAHDMINLEGLVLGHVDPGRYELIALPLALSGADASPVRAVLKTIED